MPTKRQSAVSFLDELPASGPSSDGVTTEKREVIGGLMNQSIELRGNGNYPEAVRCLNRALSLSPSYSMKIGLHWNRAVVIASWLGLGTKNVRKTDLDFCIALEQMRSDLEAVIAIYAIWDDLIAKRDDAKIFHSWLESAIRNLNVLLPVGHVYAEGSSYHEYERRLQKKWDVGFVKDEGSQGAAFLVVDGRPYRQHLIRK